MIVVGLDGSCPVGEAVTVAGCGDDVGVVAEPVDSAWESWRLHTLDVRMGHDRKPINEAVPR